MREERGARPPSLVAFGELLLRLDPGNGDRLVQARAFEARYTGAEANVAASLSGFGVPTELVSAVPDTALGQACINYLRQFGVGTDLVVRRPGRLGLLFHEPGGVGRPAEVIYDRTSSAFATCEPSAYEWRRILAHHAWLHVSGTAFALGRHVRAAAEQGIAMADELGLRVSLDVNYRASLWSFPAARRALVPVMRHVDVLVGLGRDTAAIFGLDLDDGEPALAAHVHLARRLRERLQVPLVAGLVRVGDEERTYLHGVAVDAAGAHVGGPYPILDPAGRIGTGDAFTAGLLRGLLLGADCSDAIRFATAAAHLKQSVRGDINIATASEVQAVLSGAPADRVRR